jgi:paraquat-inducible protein A
MARVLPLLLFAATFCFALGITLPLIQVERLYVFTDEPSLIEIVRELFNGGDYVLGLLVAGFSLGFPALKLSLLHMAAYRNDAPRVPAWLTALSNWSMLDVVLVALIIFAAKNSGLADAFALSGLWFFAASVVLTATAAALAKYRHGPA